MGQSVWVVICIDPDEDDEDAIHVFSTPQKAEAYAEGDDERTHVIYEYVLDEPETEPLVGMESPSAYRN